jgi:hypothetical protein
MFVDGQLMSTNCWNIDGVTSERHSGPPAVFKGHSAVVGNGTIWVGNVGSVGIMSMKLTRGNTDEWCHGFPNISVVVNKYCLYKHQLLLSQHAVPGLLTPMWNYAYMRTTDTVFCVLLTLHRGIILVNDQLDAEFFFLICLFQCFEQPRAHHQKHQLYSLMMSTRLLETRIGLK